jgi:hypothetical protein
MGEIGGAAWTGRRGSKARVILTGLIRAGKDFNHVVVYIQVLLSSLQQNQEEVNAPVRLK